MNIHLVRIDHQGVARSTPRRPSAARGRPSPTPHTRRRRAARCPAAAQRSAIAGTGIHRGGGGRADCGDDSGDVVQLEQLRPQPELVVRRHAAELHPEHARVLLDRGVRMIGGDDHGPPRVVPRGDQGGERRRRGAVLDVPMPVLRKTDQLRDPIGDEQLQLGGRRRRPPQEADGVQRRREQLGEDAGLSGRAREICEVARALPVRPRRAAGPRRGRGGRSRTLAPLRRGRRQAGTEVARLSRVSTGNSPTRSR